MSSLGRTLVILLALGCGHSASAAALRSFVQVRGPSVHLSDLFSGLTSGQDCILGNSPAPGDRYTIEQPQLEAIAVQFGVEWSPVGDGHTVVLDRPSRTIDEGAASNAVLAALQETNDKAVIVFTDYKPMIVDRDATLVAGVGSRGATSFTVVLTASIGKLVIDQEFVTGHLDRLIPVLVTLRSIQSGDVLEEQDVASRNLVSSRVHGDVLTTMSDAVGLISTRFLPDGQPIRRSDLRHPDLVLRGSAVRVDLDGYGIELTAVGTAIEAGALGEHIRVENPSSRAILSAWVIGRNEVRVDPASAPVGGVGPGYGTGSMAAMSPNSAARADQEFERGTYLP